MSFLRALFGEGTVKSMTVVLDRVSQSYMAGETITGRMVISLLKPLEVGRLEATFTCHSRTSVHVAGTNPRNTVGATVVNQTGHIKKLDDNNGIHSLVHESCDLFRQNYPFHHFGTVLNEGTHELPFQFVVPINGPSTFHYQRFADIEYRIKVRAGNETKELSIDIRGLPSVSPNELYVPVFDVNTKTVGIFNGKHLKMKCSIPRAGWTAGQPVPIRCHIDNHSDRLMTLRAKLKQTIHISAYGNPSVYRETVATIMPDQSQVPPRAIGLERALSFLLPSNLPVVYNTCRNIKIEYHIEVELDIPLAFNHHCKLPIIVTNQLLDQPMQPQPYPQPPPPPGQSQYHQYQENLMPVTPSAPPMVGFVHPPPPYSPSEQPHPVQPGLYPSLAPFKQ